MGLFHVGAMTITVNYLRALLFLWLIVASQNPTVAGRSEISDELASGRNEIVPTTAGSSWVATSSSPLNDEAQKTNLHLQMTLMITSLKFSHQLTNRTALQIISKQLSQKVEELYKENGATVKVRVESFRQGTSDNILASLLLKASQVNGLQELSDIMKTRISYQGSIGDLKISREMFTLSNKGVCCQPHLHLGFEYSSDGEQAYDDSGRDNNALLMGSRDVIIRDVTRCRNALNLGSGRLSFRSSCIPKTTKSLTIAIWLKLNSIEGNQPILIIANNGSQELRFEINDGKLFWAYADTKSPGTGFRAVWRRPLKTKTWTHVAAQYDSGEGNAQIYVNGAVVVKARGLGDMTLQWKPMTAFGSVIKDGSTRVLDGIVDELFVYMCNVPVSVLQQLALRCGAADEDCAPKGKVHYSALVQVLSEKFDGDLSNQTSEGYRSIVTKLEAQFDEFYSGYSGLQKSKVVRLRRALPGLLADIAIESVGNGNSTDLRTAFMDAVQSGHVVNITVDPDVAHFAREVSPPGCGNGEFYCGVPGECVPQTLRCNGQMDCRDASDEQDCGIPTVTTTSAPQPTKGKTVLGDPSGPLAGINATEVPSTIIGGNRTDRPTVGVPGNATIVPELATRTAKDTTESLSVNTTSMPVHSTDTEASTEPHTNATILPVTTEAMMGSETSGTTSPTVPSSAAPTEKSSDTEATVHMTESMTTRVTIVEGSDGSAVLGTGPAVVVNATEMPAGVTTDQLLTSPYVTEQDTTGAPTDMPITRYQVVSPITSTSVPEQNATVLPATTFQSLNKTTTEESVVEPNATAVPTRVNATLVETTGMPVNVTKMPEMEQSAIAVPTVQVNATFATPTGSYVNATTRPGIQPNGTALPTASTGTTTAELRTSVAPTQRANTTLVAPTETYPTATKKPGMEQNATALPTMRVNATLAATTSMHVNVTKEPRMETNVTALPTAHMNTTVAATGMPMNATMKPEMEQNATALPTAHMKTTVAATGMPTNATMEPEMEQNATALPTSPLNATLLAPTHMYMNATKRPEEEKNATALPTTGANATLVATTATGLHANVTLASPTGTYVNATKEPKVDQNATAVPTSRENATSSVTSQPIVMNTTKQPVLNATLEPTISLLNRTAVPTTQYKGNDTVQPTQSNLTVTETFTGSLRSPSTKISSTTSPTQAANVSVPMTKETRTTTATTKSLAFNKTRTVTPTAVGNATIKATASTPTNDTTVSPTSEPEAMTEPSFPTSPTRGNTTDEYLRAGDNTSTTAPPFTAPYSSQGPTSAHNISTAVLESNVTTPRETGKPTQTTRRTATPTTLTMTTGVLKSLCPSGYFYCGTGPKGEISCINKALRCNGIYDCSVTGWDEDGCGPPEVSVTPAITTNIAIGSTYYCTCVATGIYPTQSYAWLHNGKPLNASGRITIETFDGKSSLEVINATREDSGSYACVAENIKGTGNPSEPSCQLQVRAPGEACKPPQFNSIAISESECHDCFCMGRTDQCNSSTLYKDRVSIKFKSDADADGFRLIHASGADVQRSQYTVDAHTQELVAANMSGDVVYYWKLPPVFLEKKFVSYGGSLHYTIRYSHTSKSVGARRVRRDYVEGVYASDVPPGAVEGEEGGETEEEKGPIPVPPSNRPTMSPATTNQLATQGDNFTTSPLANRPTKMTNIPTDQEERINKTEESSTKSATTSLGRTSGVPITPHAQGSLPPTEAATRPRPTPSIPTEIPSETPANTSTFTPSTHTPTDTPTSRVVVASEYVVSTPSGPTLITNVQTTKAPTTILTERPTHCSEGNRTYTIGEIFVTDNCSERCLCTEEGRLACIGLCPPPQTCSPQERKTERMVLVPGSECQCREITCISRVTTPQPTTVPTKEAIDEALGDVVLVGQGVILTYSHVKDPSPDTPKEMHVPLAEDVWYTPEKRRPSRFDMMRLLSGIDSILVRATYTPKVAMETFSIKDVALDVTGSENKGLGRAVHVEQCACPRGYTGPSCESCSAGHYVVRTGNPFTDICIPCQCHGHSDQCDANTGICYNCTHNTEGPYCSRCKAGFYGDPTAGTTNDCRSCPCPLTQPSNSFSPTCFLGGDGKPTCDNCSREYTGRNCERCSKNYTGNPLILGEKCLIKGPDSCDLRGSFSDKPDNTTRLCKCKEYATGWECHECKGGAFGFGLSYSGGCIKCFCSGVTDKCESSERNRTQIGIRFLVGQRQGISITDLTGTFSMINMLYNPRSYELVFQGFDASAPQRRPLFWKLPKRFLGNKIASYGGVLMFVASYVARKGGDPIDSPTAIIKGNGTIIQHHSKEIFTGFMKRFSIQINETLWNHIDGRAVTRDQLMMILTSLEYILIKASHDTNTIRTSIREAYLDVAIKRFTYQPRAVRVEKCACPPGYSGLSCETCEPGYYRKHEGKFLGKCLPCNCNRHAKSCDANTGKCNNCLHNTIGKNCEQCKKGYYGDPTVGTEDDCRPCACPMTKPPNKFSSTCFLDKDGKQTCDNCQLGYKGRNCESCLTPFVGNPLVIGDYCKFEEDCGCDPRGSANSSCNPFTRQCLCKENVQGLRCNECKPSYFNLDSDMPGGCMPCFCFGVSQECKCARTFRDKVVLTYRKSTDSTDSDLRLGDLSGDTIAKTGILVVGVPPQYVFNRFDRLARKTYYWYLPSQFSGEKITSYGGTLKFSLSHDMLQGGSLTREPDVIIKGRGLVLVHNMRFPPPGGQETKHQVKFLEPFWKFPDGQEASREDMMITLSAVDQILLRATYGTTTYQASLSSASMDVAVPQNTLKGQVYSVEQCTCPPQYSGLSCQRCAPGYTRVKPGPGFSKCTRCKCNRHSLECDPETGKCINCDHNTAGDRCEKCASGFYGDATQGTPVDCKPCSCPLTIASNQFSPTCRIDSDGAPTCTACRPGYTGRDCGRCVHGYSGNPRSPGGKCEKVAKELLPKAVMWPLYRRDSEGTTTIFYCLSDGKRPLAVTWSRNDDRPVPPRALADSRALRIPNVSKGDEGVYVCTVKNAYGQHTAKGRLSVLARPREPIVVSVSPKTLNLASRQTARFVCRAKSKTYATVKWSKGLKGTLPSGATDKDGVLTIPYATRIHTGIYTCTGSNQYSYDQNSVQLRVAAPIEPQVSILPRFMTVDEGEVVQFRCTASGFPSPVIQWLGGPGGQLPKESVISDENRVLTIPQAKKAHEGEYFCTARNEGGVGTMRTMLYVRAAGSIPVISVKPKSLTVTEGDDAEFECKATGNPVPSIRWARVEGSFPDGATTINGVLRIERARMKDEGTFVCTAANRFGAVADSASLVVEKDTSVPPTAQADPKSQRVHEGAMAIITCKTTGVPKPSLKWNRVGGVLNSNHVIQTNQLGIVNVTEQDEGMYVCIVQNKKGVQQATSVLEVIKNVFPVVSIQPSPQQTVAGGETVVFRCAVNAGMPPPFITWSRDGQPINNTQDNSTAHVIEGNVLKIAHAFDSDSGRYACRATNLLGTAEAIAVLNVKAEPQVTVSPSRQHYVATGRQVELLCTVTGYPVPSIEWIVPNRTGLSPSLVKVAQGVLKIVIENVTSPYEGRYRCMAKNNLGTAEEVVQLFVVPNVTRPNNVSVQPVNQKVVKGNTATFNCTASGVPTPQLVWERLGAKMPETAMTSDKGLLTIESVGADDSGEYECIATNSEGSERVLAKLEVIVPPDVAVSPQQVSINLGRPFRLFCVSNPPLPLTWSKVNGTISNSSVVVGGVLIVQEAIIQDTGKYRCHASNIAGSDEGFAMVTVLVAPEADVSPVSHVASIGSNVTFTCNATGIPEPVYTWTKENNNLPDNHVVDQGRLTIYDLSAVDQGRYMCTAANAAGYAQRDISLTIEDLPSVTIVDGTSVKTVPVGANLTLECIGTGIPKPSIQWNPVEGSLPIGIVVEEGLLHITNAKSSFGGAYRCTVTNTVGSVQSQIVVFVQVAPKVTITPPVVKIKEGEPAELTCIASGSPAPETQWRRLNGSLPVTHSIKGGRLQLMNVTHEDAGMYICRATNKEGTAEGFATIKIKGTVPRFEQSPSSYMVLPTLTKQTLNFTIEIFFSPEIADGIIIYNDQIENGTVGDYISFGMSDGFAEFRFDLGSAGPAIIRSHQQLTLYQWYTVVLTRQESEGTLQVDSQPVRRGSSKGKSTGLNLNQNMFLGGVANYSKIDRFSGFNRGFIGCISYIKVDNNTIRFDKSLEKVGVTDCEPCLTKPCKNAGTCSDTRDHVGFTCHCRPGYKGRTCEGVGERCSPGVCNKGRCVNRGDTGFDCLCPVGFKGDRCQEGSVIETPQFDVKSFMSFPGIQGALLKIKLSMRFMANDASDGLLLYNGQRLHPNRGDFVSIAIVGGNVEFRYDLGYGRAVIRSKKNITVGQWHTVVAERYRRDGSLILDSEPAVKSQAPCCSVGLNLALPLYVGGVLNFETIDTDKVGVNRGFKGCISDVAVDDNPIDLINSYVKHRGIEQCTECLLPCQIEPCVNNGTCIPRGQTGYMCACGDGFTGKNCEFPLVGPGKNRTCMNGGLPFPPSGRVCDCPVGYAGKRCESVVQLEDSMSFLGDGYVQYPGSVMRRKPLAPETMTISIKTTTLEGVIFWQGQNLGASKGDYKVIGIRRGFLEYSYELGAGPAVLRSRRRVDDGQWHFVKVFRRSQDGALQIDDDEIVNGTSKNGARSLNTPGPIFIGGGDDVETLTYGKYAASFRGCVSGIYLQNRKLRVLEDAVQGYNVMQCDASHET